MNVLEVVERPFIFGVNLLHSLLRLRSVNVGVVLFAEMAVNPLNLFNAVCCFKPFHHIIKTFHLSSVALDLFLDYIVHEIMYKVNALIKQRYNNLFVYYVHDIVYLIII